MKFRGREISLAWLRPPPMPEDGNMALTDHLRELRYRLVVIMLAIVVGMVLCGFFYAQLFEILMHPLRVAEANLKVSRPELRVETTQNDVTAPFMTFIKVIGISGVVLTSPIWLHQVWAFIVPGLLAKEKKWARIFVGAATPLFIAGVVTAYILMPQAVTVLLAFTPENQGLLNLLTVSNFLSLLVRIMLVFGVSYLIPLAILLLNFMGVVKAAHLAKFRPAIIFGTFVFAAVATPSTDPFSMLGLAIPLTVLLLVTELIAWFNDRRRAKRDLDPIANDVVLQAMYAEDERKERERKELEASPAGESDAGLEREAVAKAIESGKN